MEKRNLLANPWLIFAIGAMSHYGVMFNRVAVGQMFPQLMAEFNTTGVGVAALSSIYYYTYAIMQVPAGSLADTLGPRKLMSFGMFIGALGWFIFASAQSLAVASIARLISGFGLAGIFLGLLKSISIWFPAKKFGTLTGLSTFFGNLGVATAMFPFVILVGALGWRGASFTVACVTLTLSVLIWLLVKDEGPYGVGHVKADFKATLKTIFKGTAEVFTSKGSLQPFFGFLLIFGGLMTFTGLWGVPFLMQVHGIPQSVAGSLLVISTAGGATAAILVGWLTDRSGRPKLLFTILASFQAIAWIMLILSMRAVGQGYTVYMIGAAMLLMGFSNSSFLPAFVIMRRCNKPEHAGLAQGLNNGSGFVGAIVMQAIVSAVMDYKWQGAYFTEGVRLYSMDAYKVGFLICFTAICLAMVCGMLMPRDLKR